MPQIRSTWTLPVPPPLTGLLTAAEWSAAAQMTIPHGTLLAQNDATHLYLGLDITAETGAANPNDYFQIQVDVNDNGVVDAYRDKLFGIVLPNQNALTLAYMLGPGTSTGANVIPTSHLKSGFGPSLLSATPHRQWQIAFALSDLDLSPIDPSLPSPIVDFGVWIGTIGGFSQTLPLTLNSSFANLNSIVLATVPGAAIPPTSLDQVIAAIGLVGTGDIATDGYCTIPGPYYITPDQASFCGTLNFIGDVAALNALWANPNPATKAVQFIVNHRYGATVAACNAAAFAPILQNWANYEIVGVTDVWQSFAPNAAGYYTFVDPGTPYTIQNLLFQWDTSAEPDGVHQFEILFYTVSKVLVPTPAQIVTLTLDNQAPQVDLISILHGGAVVPPCLPVNLTSATDGVQLQFEAYDPEGDLYGWSLVAEWGHGQSAVIASDGYAAHATPGHIWQGVLSDTQPASPAVWVPPTTCAYLFQINATARSTNGYSYPVISSDDFQTITLVKPGAPSAITIKPVALRVPAGLKVSPESGDSAHPKGKMASAE